MDGGTAGVTGAIHRAGAQVGNVVVEVVHGSAVGQDLKIIIGEGEGEPVVERKLRSRILESLASAREHVLGDVKAGQMNGRKSLQHGLHDPADTASEFHDPIPRIRTRHRIEDVEHAAAVPVSPRPQLLQRDAVVDPDVEAFQILFARPCRRISSRFHVLRHITRGSATGDPVLRWRSFDPRNRCR